MGFNMLNSSLQFKSRAYGCTFHFKYEEKTGLLIFSFGKDRTHFVTLCFLYGKSIYGPWGPSLTPAAKQRQAWHHLCEIQNVQRPRCLMSKCTTFWCVGFQMRWGQTHCWRTFYFEGSGERLYDWPTKTWSEFEGCHVEIVRCTWIFNRNNTLIGLLYDMLQNTPMIN